MVWQKIVGHINGERIMVESKSGNTYGVDTNPTDADHVYSHEVNEKNDWDLWAWVEFEDGAWCGFVCTGDPQGDPPKSPPGEL